MITLPDGWTNNDLTQFIQAELSEDKPGGSSYPMFRAYGNDFVIYSDDWGDTLYQIGADLTDSDGGKDMVWGETAEEVTPMTKYVKVAEMSKSDFPRVMRFSALPISGGKANMARVEGDSVILSGVVFKPGNYEDKKFAATAEQLKGAASRFKPVQNRVNHPTGSEPGLVPSYFDGHMGQLTSLAFDEAVNALVGDVSVPTWFYDFHQAHYPGEPLRNSLEIDRETYDVVGNVLVPNPRVSASALMSAHARFANSGDPSDKRGNPMGKTGTETPKEAPAEQPKTVSFADYEKLQAEAAADRARIATMAAERREEKAAAFAETQIRTGKMVPALRGHLKGLYVQAAKDDDAQGGTVTFATESGADFTGTRVGALEAAFAALPATVLTKEYIPGDHGVVTMGVPTADFAKKDAEEAAKAAKEHAEKQRDAQSRNGR